MKRLLPLMLITLALFVLAGNAQAGKNTKAFVCHKGDDGEYKTLRISSNAVDAHLNHGDMLGRCEDMPTEQAVVIFRCGSNDLGEGSLLVTSVSLSLNVPDEILIATGDECADANADLLNGGFDLSDARPVGDGTTEYMYLGEFKVMEPADPE
jgi:hypothetical protein